MLPSVLQHAPLGNWDLAHLVEVVLNCLHLRVVRRDPEPHQAERCWQSVDYINGDVAPQLCLFLAAQKNACNVRSMGRWASTCSLWRLNLNAVVYLRPTNRARGRFQGDVADLLLNEPPDSELKLSSKKPLLLLCSVLHISLLAAGTASAHLGHTKTNVPGEVRTLLTP